MSLKENFAQAVRELLSTPQLVLETAGSPAAEVGSDRIKSINPFSRREEYVPPAPEPTPEPVVYTPAPAPVTPPAPTPAPAPTPMPTSPSIYRDMPRSDRETTTIATGTVIQGSVRANCAVELFGEVYGDIVSKDNLKICGRLEGSACGQDIDITNGRIKGDVISTGRVCINNNSIVLGNIKAETLLLNGKVKGSLEIKGNLALDVNAAVAGNVLAGKLSIAEGAILQGEVRISSTDLNKLFAEGEAAGKRPDGVKAPAATAPAPTRKPAVTDEMFDEIKV